MAAKLSEEPGVEVERKSGGLGEFSVSIDERKVLSTSRWWYPNPWKVVRRVREMLAK